MKIPTFEEYINERLFKSSIDRIKSGEARKEDIVRPQTKEELKDIIKSAVIHSDKSFVDLNFIDVSDIIDMSYLFYDLKNIITKFDVSKWDVSNVKDMTNMFNCCKDFNCDLSNWDVSKVKNMRQMFCRCYNFNSNLSNWDVSKVKDMSGMFLNCEKFNSDLSKWNVSNVKYMRDMFSNCKNFDSDLNNWDVSNIREMWDMFQGCDKIATPGWYH